MRVAGVDLGSRKAAVAQYVISAKGVISLWDVTSFYVHPTQRGHELALLSQMVRDAVQGANYVFIEEPLVGRGVKASMQISQTAGAIMSATGLDQIHTELVNVSTWKSRIVGDGRASKETVEMWLTAQHRPYADACGEGTDRQDKVDACCIGLFGVSCIEQANGGLLASER